MLIRTATLDDIPQIQSVRHAVKENILSDPALVTDADCADYLTRRGKGWVCEKDGQIIGFAIADLLEHNIWALFVLPEHESRGVGRRLHDRMLDWYFQQTNHTVWLGTAPGTRAERFYTRAGWTRAGTVNKGEVKFEMRAGQWKRMQNGIFKPSRSANRLWNLFKTFFQTALFWVFFLYLIPGGIRTLETRLDLMTFSGAESVGWVLFFVFSLLGLYSGYTMSWHGKGTPLPVDCPNALVISGPYRFVRNPMAVAGIGQGVSVGLLTGSYLTIAYALAGAVLWHLLVRPLEEKDLEKRFGAAYREYKKNTRCWIPRRGRVNLAD